jgi:hypothetical protein
MAGSPLQSPISDCIVRKAMRTCWEWRVLPPKALNRKPE